MREHDERTRDTTLPRARRLQMVLNKPKVPLVDFWA